MSIEEQIRELIEVDRRIQRRHEALADAVELLVAVHRENEATLTETRRANAAAHEHRLNDVEGGQA